MTTPSAARSLARDRSPGTSTTAADQVRSAFLRLAERFRPAEAGDLTATWVIEIDGAGETTIHVRDGRCLVSPGSVAAPDARLATDPETWLALVEGAVDGVAAFLAGRLRVDGDLNLAVRLETLFAPGPDDDRRLRMQRHPVRGQTIEALTAGSEGSPVLLLHGLGASKVSFLPTVDALAGTHEVHALDLPGFGRSDKPLPAGRRYTMAWMADQVRGYLDEADLGPVHVVGNSMGGRIGVELALRHPSSVRSLVGLGAAVAFDEYRRLAPMLRLVRAQWAGVAPLPARRQWVERGLRELFHDPERVPAANFRAAAEDALLSVRDRGYRLALLSCARQLGIEPTDGRRSYWDRLRRLEVPSYWIYGGSDRLVRARYADRVAAALPAARVEVWDDLGHVPQFELPERTHNALLDWLGRVDAAR